MLYFFEVVNILKPISYLVPVGEVCNMVCERLFSVFFIHYRRLSLSNTQCSNWNAPSHIPPLYGCPMLFNGKIYVTYLWVHCPPPPAQWKLNGTFVKTLVGGVLRFWWGMREFKLLDQ